MKNISNVNTGFFEDPNGNKSSTRVKTFLAALVAMFIAVADVFMDSVSAVATLPIIITLLAYSAGEKSFQCLIESKTFKS